MRFNIVNENLFTPGNMKYIEINNFSSNPNIQKNFAMGLQNARKLLEGLEHSFYKTKKYEKRLVRCKASHAHSHEWCDSDLSDYRNYKSRSETTNFSRDVDLAESWSTISIVCMQYQYEDLLKKYKALQHAYHEYSSSACNHQMELARIHAHTQLALAQLSHAHSTLINIGDKYLNLRRKTQMQKSKYEAKIKRLKTTIRGVMMMCEHALVQLDTRLDRFMQTEKNGPNTQLLAEIRKCNLLYLENLKLKAKIEELSPGGAYLEK